MRHGIELKTQARAQILTKLIVMCLYVISACDIEEVPMPVCLPALGLSHSQPQTMLGEHLFILKFLTSLFLLCIKLELSS